MSDGGGEKTRSGRATPADGQRRAHGIPTHRVRRMWPALGQAVVVLGLLALCAPAGADSDLEAGLRQAADLLEAWQEEAAAAALAPLVASHGDDPRLLVLQAELDLHLGRYDQGLTTLGRVTGDAAPVQALRKLLENTRDAVKGFREFPSKSGKFRIFTAPGADEILAPLAGEALEAAARALQEELGYAPVDAVRVEIYPEHDTLAKVSPLSRQEIERTGTIALCKYNRLMAVTPRALLRGYPWMDTLVHEYVHFVVARASGNRVPVWLHEGLAKHLETRWRTPSGQPPPLSPGQEHLLHEALRSGKLIPWEKMHPSLAKLPDHRSAALAFAQAQTAVDMLARRGEGTLRRLVAAFAAQGSGFGPITQVSGLSRGDFENAWRRHLKSLAPRAMPGLRDEPPRFGKKPSEDQVLAQVKEDRARDFLRLADLLRKRGHSRAAILEYQKARRILGPRDELVANHLARAYLEVGSPTQAVSALLPVLEYYPELAGPQVTMGIAYLRAGDLEAAARHLRVALRVNPFNPEVHCGLAKVLEEGEERTRHRTFCQKLASGGDSDDARGP